MRGTLVVLVAAGALLLAAGAAQARTLIDNSEVGHGACVLSTDPDWNASFPSPGPYCIINLDPSTERCWSVIDNGEPGMYCVDDLSGGADQLRHGGYFKPIHRGGGHAKTFCWEWREPGQAVCSRGGERGSGGAAGDSAASPADGVISDPLRWPHWHPMPPVAGGTDAIGFPLFCRVDLICL